MHTFFRLYICHTRGRALQFDQWAVAQWAPVLLTSIFVFALRELQMFISTDIVLSFT